MAVKFYQEVLQDDVAHCTQHTPGFSVALYSFTYFASDLALRYVISNYLRNEYMDSEFLRLVGLWPTMMPVEGGSPSGLPGGPCASSVIILPLDPHLVDASVNFEDLGYLHSLTFAFAFCNFCILDLGYLNL